MIACANFFVVTNGGGRGAIGGAWSSALGKASGASTKNPPPRPAQPSQEAGKQEITRRCAQGRRTQWRRDWRRRTHLELGPEGAAAGRIDEAATGRLRRVLPLGEAESHRA